MGLTVKGPVRETVLQLLEAAGPAGRTRPELCCSIGMRGSKLQPTLNELNRERLVTTTVERGRHTYRLMKFRQTPPETRHRMMPPVTWPQ